MSREDFVKAIAPYCWYAPAEQMTDIMLAIADEYPVGTVLGIRLHEPHVRL